MKAGDLDRALAALASQYGSGLKYPLSDPSDVLFATVLSQATSDVNSGRAFKALRAQFPDWSLLAEADPSLVGGVVAPAGFGPTRGKRLVAIARRLFDDFGAVTLNPLVGRVLEETMSYLESLPGVGPKTAACVALFGFGLPVVPVDTHVGRVAERLGWVRESSDVAERQRTLTAMVPPECALDLHLQLIELGRKVCRARRPRCPDCVIRQWCCHRAELDAGG